MSTRPHFHMASLPATLIGVPTCVYGEMLGSLQSSLNDELAYMDVDSTADCGRQLLPAKALLSPAPELAQPGFGACPYGRLGLAMAAITTPTQS